MIFILGLCFIFSFATGYLGWKFATFSIQLGIGFTCFMIVFGICSLLMAQVKK